MIAWDEVAQGLTAYFNDEGEFREAFWEPRRADVIIDVGCAEGSYTIPALLSGARAIAVDSSADRLGRLKECATLAGADLDLLTSVNKALWDGSSYPDELHQQDLAAAPDAEFTTLDQLVRDCHLRRLDWVKIDAEGAELGILRGGRKSLARFHPQLVIEDHTPTLGHLASVDAEAMGDLLADLGYGQQTQVPTVGPTSGDRTMWVCAS